MDSLTPEQRHKNMSQIRSNNTSIEILLRKALWHEGIRYRKNFKTLPGSPDIAITKYKIAIFCDGEFWHGKNWIKKKDAIKTNRDFWLSKIERNIIRDNKNENALKNMGWVVLRFWGDEINKKLADCVNEIKETIYEIKHGIYNREYYNNIDFLVAENDLAYNIKDDNVE
jgi:DNA mismatch endonuclease (patch repair protein)